MSDSVEKKGFLNAIHTAVKWLLHIVLIPIVAICKGLGVLFTHLHDELAKF